MSEAKCELCGEPMPEGEEMFKFHGYSGPCPKTPLVQNQPASTESLSPNDPTMVKIHIESCITSLRDEDGRSKTRELSLAVTKLQEATMWIDEHLRLS